MMNQTNANPVEFLKSLPTPTVDFEAVLATQKRNVETAIEAYRVATEGLKAIARRQEEIVKETVSTLQSKASTIDAPEKYVELATSLAHKSFDQVREIAELAAKTNKDVLDVVVKRSNDAVAELKAAVKLPQA
jgi:phasin family protein